MSNKTALQQLKQTWELKQKELTFGVAAALISEFLKDIEQLLPMEQEQLEEAYRGGGWRDYDSAGDYFI